MKKLVYTGSGVALVTPMHKDGSINYEKFGELIEFQISHGTDAIIACATTGESPVLNHEEHCKALEYVIQKVNKRVPVIASTGSNDTAYAVQLSQEAERMGADALLSVTPYYNKTSQAGLVRHYTYIADRVNLPIIVYNVFGTLQTSKSECGQRGQRGHFFGGQDDRSLRGRFLCLFRQR